MKITIEPTEQIIDKGGLCALFAEGQSDEEFRELKELYIGEKNKNKVKS